MVRCIFAVQFVEQGNLHAHFLHCSRVHHMCLQWCYFVFLLLQPGYLSVAWRKQSSVVPIVPLLCLIAQIVGQRTSVRLRKSANQLATVTTALPESVRNNEKLTVNRWTVKSISRHFPNISGNYRSRTSHTTASLMFTTIEWAVIFTSTCLLWWFSCLLVAVKHFTTSLVTIPKWRYYVQSVLSSKFNSGSVLCHCVREPVNNHDYLISKYFPRF